MNCAGILLAIILAFPAQAGSEASGNLDLWPFVVRDGRPIAGVRTTRIAGPFFESWERDTGEVGWTLRPLLASSQQKERHRLEFLYPLGSVTRSPDGTRFRLTPFLDQRMDAPAKVRAEAEADPGSPGPRSWSFLALFGGISAEGERYLGLFPLGGVLRNRFGIDRLDFWLFPLFARARYPSGFQRTWLLWPFFSWGSGGDRELLKIWPLFGRDVRKGEFERHYAAWPFVHWRRERIGSGGEHRVRLLLPLYGESRGAHSVSRFILGPLFLRAEDDRSGARSTDLLWPLVRWSHHPGAGGAGSREIRVEPFFQRRTTPTSVRTHVLLGAIDWFDAREEGLSHSGLRLLYVNRFESLKDDALDIERTRRELFPLFRYGEDRQAGIIRKGRLSVPWLLPLAGAGWQRHLLGITTLYERRWTEEERRSDWLWGLARHRRAPAYRLDALSWLYRREQEGSKPSTRRLLGIPLP